ncbi:MAG: short-chain dehydrogenase [candidate division WOR-3 bacterium]
MNFKGKNVLILGGTGLVGRIIAEKALALKASSVTILGLYEHEITETFDLLIRGTPTKEKIGEVPCWRKGRLAGFWGNVFVRTEFKDSPRAELLADEKARRTLIEDTYLQINDDIIHASYLYWLFMQAKPHIVYDSINTATALAYQNVYDAALDLYEEIKSGKDVKTDAEKFLLTAYTPQLVRHMEILKRAMKDAGTELYVKIGTTGTGGMGWDIPYTHSEDRPSRVLLSKTAMAGAQSMLFFIMSRAGDAPAIKELKPAAAIAWQGIGIGKITKGGKPIEIYDSNEPLSLSEKESIAQALESVKFKNTRKTLKSVYIDTGENGLFSLGEFVALSALGQMEYITPEEIADYAIYESLCQNTGRDVIDALEGSVMGPTYRGGILRDTAIKRLLALEQKNKEFPSVAFEILGPPRLTKLLYEAHILKETYGDMRKVVAAEPSDISKAMSEFILKDDKVRQACLSVGIPVLLPDGKLLAGPHVVIPLPRERSMPATPQNVERWADAGWVDTRPKNAEAWQARCKAIISDARARSRRLKRGLSGSSREDRGFLNPKTLGVDYSFNPGEIVAWVFINEEKGKRTRR